MAMDVEALLKEWESDDDDIDISGITLEELLEEDIDDLGAAKRIQKTEKEFMDELIVPWEAKDGKTKNSKSNHQLRTPLEIAEIRERQLLSSTNAELVSPLQVKRRLIARTNIRNKTRVDKYDKNEEVMKGVDLHIGVSSSVVKVEALETVSRQLQKSAEFKEHGPGSPTSVAVHPRFIAIGTSNSLILVFDHFQKIQHVLGNAADRTIDGPVTALDFTSGSDFLVSGYQSGRIVLWDMIKGSALKAVSEVHNFPVVALQFTKHQKSQIISVDTNGIVNKLNFSKMMGYMYVVDTDLILDGAAGKVPSISVLPQHINTKSANSSNVLAEQYSLVALSSDKTTFVIAVEPEVRVLHRWPRPANSEGHVLPSLSFQWVTIAGCARSPAPVLVRGWGKHVQFLEVTFPGGANHTHSRHGWPNFEEHQELETSKVVVAVQWFGDQVVVYLNSQDELCVYDALSRKELEVVDVSELKLVYALYRASKTDDSPARSFTNSFRAGNNILYLLGLKELRTARVQSWGQRIDTLVEDGEWLEALAIALDHFEGLKSAATDRAERDRFPPVFCRDRRGDQCVVDIFRMSQTNQRTGEQEDVFRHEDGDKVIWCCGEIPYSNDISERLESTFQKGRSGVAEANVPLGVSERVAELLMDYVRLAIANAPSSNSSLSSRVGKLDLTKSHYQMLAGVCIEYCAAVGRTDLLFGDIFRRFQECGRADTFVELLEPYIMNEKLRYLGPEAMEEFVKQYTKRNMLVQVEQCILHMKIRDLDFDTVVKLCRANSLYSALFYVYNEGLQDYVTPIDMLLDACRLDGSKSSVVKRYENQASEENTENKKRRLYAYKLLLYISYCFSGHTFPRHEDMRSEKTAAVRAQLCKHIFTKSKRLRSIVEIDVREFLRITAYLFDAPDAEFEGEANEDNSNVKYNGLKANTVCPSRLSMVVALADIFIGKGSSSKSSFSSIEQGHFHMFEARLLSSGAIDAKEYIESRSNKDNNSHIMDSLMRFIVTGSVTAGKSSREGDDDGYSREERQGVLVRLLQKLSDGCYDNSTLLRLVTREKMNRAGVILNKDNGDFSKTMQCYLADSDHEYQMNVFTYIRNEQSRFEGEQDDDEEDSSTSAAAGKNAISMEIIEKGVVEHSPALLDVDAHTTAVLILELFPRLHKKITRRLVTMNDSSNASRLEFCYLKHILNASEDATVEQTELIQELLDRTKLRMQDDTAVQERFIALLCQFEPHNVFKYLEKHDNYSLESCLDLTREYNITDAEAYLLERTGDVNGALSLILQSIEKKLKILKPALRGQSMKSGKSSLGWIQQQQESVMDSVPEAKDVMTTLEAAITMCQRNSTRHQDDQSEKLWFTLLDKLLKIQSYIKRSSATKSKSRSSRGSQSAMQVALTEYVRFVLERMITFVSLNSIMFKITHEHGNDEFGDFRSTIFGMLDTYKYEQNIYQTANELISADLYEQVTQLQAARTRCIAPASNVCYYCGISLLKPPFGMGNKGTSERWNASTSMVMVMAAGHVFHETCGQLWQQEVDKKSQKEKNSRRRKSPKSEKNEGKTEEDGPTSTSSEPISRTKNQNTRRYLARLRNSRKKGGKQVSLNQVLHSLSLEETNRNKYLPNGGSSISCAVGALPKAKKVGTRKPGSLPIKPSQQGNF